MPTFFERIKTWAPKNEERTLEEHMKDLSSVGNVDSKWIYFNPIVSVGAAVCIWALVIYSSVNPPEARTEFQKWQADVTYVWNWLYMASQNVWIAALIYCLWKHYNLKLGKDDENPEFSDITYFTLLFTCGVATGLWYFTAESMWHYEGYGNPRWMDNDMWNMNTRAEHAMAVTYFHWGIHGWIPYTTIGAVLAILHYRRNLPLSMRWTLYPLIGDMCYGILGDLVEILSILCTVFGVCTSLGLGAMQINKGLVRLDRATFRGVDEIPDGNTGITFSKETQIVIILGVTGLAVMSLVAGLKSGIATLSQIAFVMSLFILFSVMFMDETWYILNANTSTLGYYIWLLPKISFHTDAWEELGSGNAGMGGAPDEQGGSAGWMNGWTIFYWGWWISWGPFVGTFLARISKGRKLGTFILATLFLPSLWAFAFTGIFGASQIRISNQAISATQHCVRQQIADAGITLRDLPNGKQNAVYPDGSEVSFSCYNTGYCSNFTADPPCQFTYGSTADKKTFGWMRSTTNEDGTTTETWHPVPDTVTRLYNLATEDVLFEQLQSYGDSASFVVDMMAANGRPEPPLAQKIFWGVTEGMTASVLMLVAGDDDPQAALKAVQAIPIVLGLPYTFHLFYCCQSLIIVCKEEAGELAMTRKNFTNFLIFNVEPMSFVSFLAPFIPAGNVAAEILGGSKILYMMGFGFLWVFFIVLCFLTMADVAFSSMALSAYFMFGTSVGFLRVATRSKLGITGDMITDIVACNFWLPFALGQMAGEDLTAVPQAPEAIKADKIGNAEAKQVDI